MSLIKSHPILTKSISTMLFVLIGLAMISCDKSDEGAADNQNAAPEAVTSSSPATREITDSTAETPSKTVLAQEDFAGLLGSSTDQAASQDHAATQTAAEAKDSLGTLDSRDRLDRLNTRNTSTADAADTTDDNVNTFDDSVVAAEAAEATAVAATVAGNDLPAEAPPLAIPAEEGDVAAETGAAEPVTAIDWLDRFEARGKEINTLQADLVHIKENTLLGDKQTRIGLLNYAAGGALAGVENAANRAASARFAIRINQRVLDGRIHESSLDFVFDGEWLAEVDRDQKRFIRRQVVPPGQVYDPLKIDGPFPVPLGQKRDEVLARYNVELIQDAEPDAAAQTAIPIHLRLTPRQDVPQNGGKNFTSVDLWFDRQMWVPVRVEAAEKAAKTTVDLSNIKINEIDPDEMNGLFRTEPPREPGWRVISEPWRGEG